MYSVRKFERQERMKMKRSRQHSWLANDAPCCYDLVKMPLLSKGRNPGKTQHTQCNGEFLSQNTHHLAGMSPSRSS